MSSLSLRIERIDPLTSQIRRLILVAEAGHPLPGFTPGAHIEVQIPGDKPMWRAYSLVNLPDDNHYEIAVQLEDQSSGGSRVLELSLSHRMPGALGAVYARAQLLSERREAAQL